jgi:hypothetical protein
MAFAEGDPSREEEDEDLLDPEGTVGGREGKEDLVDLGFEAEGRKRKAVSLVRVCGSLYGIKGKCWAYPCLVEVVWLDGGRRGERRR